VNPALDVLRLTLLLSFDSPLIVQSAGRYVGDADDTRVGRGLMIR
jgi:hypothetical protein